MQILSELDASKETVPASRKGWGVVSRTYLLSVANSLAQIISEFTKIQKFI